MVGGSAAPFQIVEYSNAEGTRTAWMNENVYITRRLGVGGEPSQRLPINFSPTFDGSALTNTNLADKVAMQNTVLVKGDFTNETTWNVSSARHIFGANDFVRTGSADGDGKGIKNLYGRLAEVHVYAPNLPMDKIYGFQTEVHVEPSATGSTVVDAVGLLVLGGRGGTSIANRWGIKIEDQSGAQNSWAIETIGAAPSRFGGLVNAIKGLTVTGATMRVGPSTATPNIQATPAGAYLGINSGQPGLELADGSTSLRIDNNAGVLRFLRSGVSTLATLDSANGFSLSSPVTSGQYVSAPVTRVVERSTAPGAVASTGQLWVSSTDHTLHFVNNVGVDTVVGSGSGTTGISRVITSVSTGTTAAAATKTDYVYLVSAGATLQLPTAVGNTNRYAVKNTDATLTTSIATTSSQTIDGAASRSLPAGSSFDIISDGSNWRIV